MFDEVTIYPEQIEDTKLSDIIRSILDYWDAEELCEEVNQNYTHGIWSRMKQSGDPTGGGIMDNLMILAMIEDLKKEIRGVRELILELIQKTEEVNNDRV